MSERSEAPDRRSFCRTGPMTATRPMIAAGPLTATGAAAGYSARRPAELRIAAGTGCRSQIRPVNDRIFNR